MSLGGLFQILGRQMNRAFHVKPYEGMVATRTGAYRPAPDLMSFPLTKVFLVVIPGVTIGASISKYGAAFLEEHDIFVPSDDDDD
ncbi:essential MCU regulator, mitochondrial-like [Varroa jacobsoni]|uniref:Essential MCU regulator, mitochondrial n=1 Tax=Varroa destructor TaxID=109461 RepID=A0A7M7KGR4_VARDE|nr:essential MCU regulator, mitochondrial-like [Varroa destructor]XP_022665273.1 essential MCU regulator, mitochondrial-like [Varroa destructor]XP_022709489.1 essential MCU regulator, mitochondrial-like [Varroa jacobsoni]